jgi:hypothetical protein
MLPKKCYVGIKPLKKVRLKTILIAHTICSENTGTRKGEFVRSYYNPASVPMNKTF